MNSESPLVPQGSFLEQKNKGRARVKIAVFVVLAIHCVGVMALLMQGCKKPNDTAQNAAVDTNTPAPPTFVEPTNQIVAIPETNVPAPLPTNPAPTPVVTTQEIVSPVPTLPTTPTPPATVTEHKIVRGDTVAKLAKQYGVSQKAIQDANPGLDSARLKLNATVRIPAPAANTASAGPAINETAKDPSTKIYKVKSGDNLLKVAKAHGVSASAIRAANNMKTDRIRVGQPLKIPAKNGAGSTETTSNAAVNTP